MSLLLRPYKCSDAEGLLENLRGKGFGKISLSVDKTNYAVKMYRKFGFEVIAEREHDYLMLKRFQL